MRIPSIKCNETMPTSSLKIENVHCFFLFRRCVYLLFDFPTRAVSFSHFVFRFFCFCFFAVLRWPASFRRRRQTFIRSAVMHFSSSNSDGERQTPKRRAHLLSHSDCIEPTVFSFFLSCFVHGRFVFQFVTARARSPATIA